MLLGTEGAALPADGKAGAKVIRKKMACCLCLVSVSPSNNLYEAVDKADQSHC